MASAVSNTLTVLYRLLNKRLNCGKCLPEYVHNGEIWGDPKSGKLLERCPFLRLEENHKTSRVKYSCDIYYDRPDDCKYYPSNVQEMILDGCEMIEEVDLKDLKKSQAKLELIMTDSHN